MSADADGESTISAAGRIYFSGCAGLIGFALAYALPIYARLPHHYYDPVARRWALAVNLGPIPMGYVGQIGWGAAGGLFSAGLAMLVVSRRHADPDERWYGLWGAWALTAIVIVLGYFTWNNWP